MREASSFHPTPAGFPTNRRASLLVNQFLGILFGQILHPLLQALAGKLAALRMRIS
jgi:hypothetical protein